MWVSLKENENQAERRAGMNSVTIARERACPDAPIPFMIPLSSEKKTPGLWVIKISLACRFTHSMGEESDGS